MFNSPPSYEKILYSLLIGTVTIILSLVGAWAADQSRRTTALEEHTHTLELSVTQINTKLDILITQHTTPSHAKP